MMDVNDPDTCMGMICWYIHIFPEKVEIHDTMLSSYEKKFGLPKLHPKFLPF